MYPPLEFLFNRFVLILLAGLQTAVITGQVSDSSRLPLVIIHTGGKTIVDEPKITASLKIVDNPNGYNRPGDVPNGYNGPAGVELRGRYSSLLPQKSYGIETRDEAGNNNNVSLMGMPAENDWVLLSSYNDKSFMRNSLSFHLFREMGHYAPRARLCEVYLNNSYEGIYLFTEKIKRDRNRVNISSMDLNDNAGDSLTGGYIFSVDYYSETDSWRGSYSPPGYPSKSVHFVYNYPKYTEITYAQKAYIKEYINSFEKALYGSNFTSTASGYRSFADIGSFIDYFIVNELARNVDGYKKSCFYHKSRNSKGGKLSAGPVWDFDWAWKDIWDCSIFQATDGSGWAYKVLQCNPWPTPTGWIPRMMEDPAFFSELKSRYSFLRQNLLGESSINRYIDSVQSLVDEAQKRHYSRWKTLGQQVGAPEVGIPAQTYNGEVENLRAWIFRRLKWLDSQLLLTGISETIESTADNSFHLAPNPASGKVRITSATPFVKVSLFNMSGKNVMQESTRSTSEFVLYVDGLTTGMYLMRIELENGHLLTRKLVIER